MFRGKTPPRCYIAFKKWQIEGASCRRERKKCRKEDSNKHTEDAIPKDSGLCNFLQNSAWRLRARASHFRFTKQPPNAFEPGPINKHRILQSLNIWLGRVEMCTDKEAHGKAFGGMMTMQSRSLSTCCCHTTFLQEIGTSSSSTVQCHHR